jgi:hypothetical protein
VRFKEYSVTGSGPGEFISEAESTLNIVSVDFADYRSSEVRLAGLGGLAGPGYRFSRVVLPMTGPGRRAPVTCIKSLTEDVRRGHGHVLAVLGHGVGSVYAAAVADLVSGFQRAPEVILFDPQLVSARFIARELRREIDAMSSLLADAELDRARNIASEISGSGYGDIKKAARRAACAYREIGSIALERVGLGGRHGEQEIKAFESYLYWISVSDQVGPGGAWHRATVVTSADGVTKAILDLLGS